MFKWGMTIVTNIVKYRAYSSDSLILTSNNGWKLSCSWGLVVTFQEIKMFWWKQTCYPIYHLHILIEIFVKIDAESVVPELEIWTAWEILK